MYRLVITMCTLLACAIGPECCCAADPVNSQSSGDSRPNIVILLADDLGYGELGCQGNPQIPTPHIDSIAANGIRFTDGYVTASYCSPSRAGLLTGRLQNRFGYEFNPVGHHNLNPAVGLPATETTIAQALQGAGYATALIGKWHLGGHARHHPMRHGFDEFFGFLHEGHFYVPPPYQKTTTMLRRRTLPDGRTGRWTSSNERLILSTHLGYNEPPYDADNPIIRGGQPVDEAAYLTDAFTREALDFIERNGQRPFFLYLAYNAVHSPLQAPSKTVAQFDEIDDVQRRIFAAMLSRMDASVGAVLAKLRKENIEERTLVVFLSDNGGPTRELTSSNAPLRGEKGDLYEGGIRIPLLMQWPGRLPPAKVEHRPVLSLDLYPTALAAAGVTVPRSTSDGVNLWPYLAGVNRDLPHDVLYWRMGSRRAVRAGKWKLVDNDRRRDQAPWELFNLQEDLGESHDLAQQRPDKLQALRSMWTSLDEQMVEPFWSPRQ